MVLDAQLPRIIGQSIDKFVHAFVFGKTACLLEATISDHRLGFLGLQSHYFGEQCEAKIASEELQRPLSATVRWIILLAVNMAYLRKDTFNSK
jgi:hypothetical protein